MQNEIIKFESKLKSIDNDDNIVFVATILKNIIKYCNYCIQMQFDLYALILYRCYACMFYEILAPYLKLIRLMTANHVIAYTCDKGPRCEERKRRGQCTYVLKPQSRI